jgi:hypothetical protein
MEASLNVECSRPDPRRQGSMDFKESYADKAAWAMANRRVSENFLKLKLGRSGRALGE